MAKTVISIDAGSKNAHVVVGKRTKEGVKIKTAFAVPTPPGSIIDGRLEDSLIFRTALQTSFKEHKVRAKNMMFTIQGTSVISRDMVLPAVQKENLAGAVAYEMENYATVDGRNRLTEYQVVDEIVDSGITKHKIRVTTLPREMAENYYRLIREMHRKPYALNIHSNAIAKLFSREMTINEEPYVPDKTVCVMDIGHKTTHICIVNRGILDFTRLISFGGNDLDLAIAGFYKIPAAEAEAKKTSDIDLCMMDAEENSNGVYSAMRSPLTKLVNEVQKVIQYYVNRTAHAVIDTMYLLGGGSRLKGFDQYLKENLNLERVVRISQVSMPSMILEVPGLDTDTALNALGSMLK